MISRPRRKSERLIEFVVGEFFVFMKQTLPYPRLVNFCDCRSETGEKLSGEAPLPHSNLGFQTFCKKSGQPVKSIRRKLASPIPIPEMQSAFLPLAQRTAVRRPDEGLATQHPVSRTLQKYNVKNLDGFSVIPAKYASLVPGKLVETPTRTAAQKYENSFLA